MNQQESGSLREALEKLAVEWANMDCRVDLPENAQWGEGCAQGYSNAAADLLRLLAAHPVEPAREPSDAAVEAALVEDQPSWHKIPEDLRSELRLRMHAALEAAYRVDAPRPFLDREAVADAIDRHYDEDVYMPIYPEDGSRCIGSAAADAVMELARPMPTREQIAAGIHKAFDHPNAEACPITSTGWHECGYIAQSNQLADAVMDLLNGES